LCTLAFLIVFGIFIFNDQYHNYIICDNQIIKWTKVLFASFIVFCGNSILYFYSTNILIFNEVTGCMGLPLIKTKDDEYKGLKAFIGLI